MCMLSLAIILAQRGSGQRTDGDRDSWRIYGDFL